MKRQFLLSQLDQKDTTKVSFQTKIFTLMIVDNNDFNLHYKIRIEDIGVLNSRDYVTS